MSKVVVHEQNRLIRHVSRSTAHKLELTGFYERNGNILTRLAHRITPPKSFTVGRTTEHAPERFPPLDLPGLRFHPPKPTPYKGLT